ncbi:uncharacterized protein LOC112589847 [Harpegnathos saltator]|uniref:uncharacterized protein LOC112589488 n=1 Tax=Harpegnathos saltator TaxID=610380 RepID=UPI000DBEDD4E|nr:uncharacterized protein LOC112589488 [Harpegnathos saltator]XP_025158765.1 uncharacterized protein LOC112589488 [Harpegnathos saltator]XP_025160390.1 uncharacterized protein LOC112589847 [Harpegnathos saltator]XP_025160391.1 uncharacterized protein LOC112589847 [Harpegnathos saltator]
MDTPALNGNEGTQNRQESSDVSLILQGTSEKATAIFYSRKAMILDTEAAVIANFEFLGHTDMDMEEEEGDEEDEIYDAITDTKPNKASIPLLAKDVDTDAEAEVLNE